MGDNHDWRPFVYGGLSSCTAEFGKSQLSPWWHDLSLKDSSSCRYIPYWHSQDQAPDPGPEARREVQDHPIQWNASCPVKNQPRGRIQGSLFRVYSTGKPHHCSLHSLSASDTHKKRIWPAVLRQSTYGTIKFGIYYTLKNWIDHPEVEDMMTNVFCGVIAGSVSSAIANPTDVLKVRMQACSTSLQSKSLFTCFGDIYRQEGIAGLWRVSCTIKVSKLSVLTLTFVVVGSRANGSKGRRDHGRGAAHLRHLQAPLDSESVDGGHHVQSFCLQFYFESGGCRRLDSHWRHPSEFYCFISLRKCRWDSHLSMPVKVRLMNQRQLKSGVPFGFGMSSDFTLQKTSRLYRGTIDCLVQVSLSFFCVNISHGELCSMSSRCTKKENDETNQVPHSTQTVRHEGVMALYRGFIPTWLRMGPWNIIFFITYERLKQFY